METKSPKFKVKYVFFSYQESLLQEYQTRILAGEIIHLLFRTIAEIKSW